MIYDLHQSVMDDLEHIGSGCYNPDASEWEMEVCRNARAVIEDLLAEIQRLQQAHSFGVCVLCVVCLLCVCLCLV